MTARARADRLRPVRAGRYVLAWATRPDGYDAYGINHRRDLRHGAGRACRTAVDNTLAEDVVSLGLPELA